MNKIFWIKDHNNLNMTTEKIFKKIYFDSNFAINIEAIFNEDHNDLKNLNLKISIFFKI